MAAKIRRGFIGVLVMVIVTLVMIEGTLRFIDPIGAYTYFYDIYLLEQETVPHPTGYSYVSGTHEVTTFSVTIDEDGNRVVPATDDEASCTVALIGDSYTFGWGADDDAIWGNLLGAARPDVEVINTAKLGYSTENIRLSLDYAEENYAPDAYVWFIINNDHHVPYYYERPYTGAFPAATEVHYMHILVPAWRNRGAEPETSFPDAFWDDVESIMARDNIFAFGIMPDVNPLTEQVAARYPQQVMLIPAYGREHHVSAYDTHLNAAGNAYVWEQIQENMLAFIDAVCAS